MKIFVKESRIASDSIKPHIRGFFCLWDGVKKVLRIEPFVEIWNKEKNEWVEKG